MRRALLPVFGQFPLFLSDSQMVIEWLKSEGFSAIEFREVSNLSPTQRENIVMIATDNATIPPHSEWYPLFHNSKILMLPLVSFDPSMPAATYAIKMLAQSNFEAAAELNAHWVKILFEHEDILTLSGKGCHFSCEIEEGVTVAAPKVRATLLPGEWEVMGAFFELGMIPDPGEIQPGYHVNGTFTVPGVAVAHHRQMQDQLIPLATRAWDLFQELRSQDLFPLTVEVEHSKAVSIRAGKRDIASELEYLTNPRRKLVLTEMAFSTNTGITPDHIDWTKNSHFNEGAVGVHIGLGDGISGAHIDLICPEVAML